MPYKLFDINEKEISLESLQNKGAWCKIGEKYEKTFVQKYPDLGLAMNPSKVEDKYSPDLIYLYDRSLADLKTQNTPFFLSKNKYHIDPQFAVTFNEKDYLRYASIYPGIDVYFWIDWQAIKFVGSMEININPMIGVWRLTFDNMVNACKNAPLHFYMQRINDQKGNAKGSFVLDLNSKYFTRII